MTYPPGTEHACRELGIVPKTWKPLTKFAPQSSLRQAYRVTTQDGRTLKIRLLKSKNKADHLCQLRSSLSELSLSPVLGWKGRLIIEEWVSGRALDQESALENDLRSAARLLARLHTSLPCRSKPVSDEATQRLEFLADNGVLERKEVKALRTILDRKRPDAGVLGLTHGDFCGANLVLSDKNVLWSVDNDNLKEDFLDYDLGTGGLFPSPSGLCFWGSI